MNSAEAIKSPSVTREHIIWSYRLLLGREPESESIIQTLMQAPLPSNIVENILASPEFKSTNPVYAAHLVNKWAMIECSLGFSIWVNLADAAISWPIIDGQFEPKEIEFVTKHAKPGMAALDIGTNIGFFSLLLATIVGPSGSVIGFEPMPTLHSHAVKSVAANGFINCTIHRTALCDRKGTMRLLDNPISTNRGGAYLDTGGDHHPTLTATEVAVARLSDFADHPVDFIKIDVEGAESLVLKPYLDHLIRHKPLIMSEVSPTHLARVSRVSNSDYISMFLDIGYDCVDIQTGRPVGRDGIDTKFFTNVGFIPK